ncbi:helix-turn-helix domain-containing protein [Streptomyces echinatus]|uniref:helix-turn-helix domain-containing protein n=1 Tax=Streptomyces echinatus TaxID=67293 RepID=UPI0037B9EC36
MTRQRGAGDEAAVSSLDEQMRAAKTAIAARLRHVRQHHPEGPFTLAALAERTGVSKRTLASAESEDGMNLTLETLVKVAHSLGIQRWAYFLDEEVFAQVNAEFETVRELRQRAVQGVALRTTSAAEPSAASLSELSELVIGILRSAKAASDTLKGISSPSGEQTSSDAQKL